MNPSVHLSSRDVIGLDRVTEDVCPACGELFVVLSGHVSQRLRTDANGKQRLVVIDHDHGIAHLCEVTDPGPALDALLRLRGAKSLHEIHETVRTAARHLVRADGATFVLRNGDECVYVDEDAMSPLWRGQRFPVTDCISGWAMLNNQHAVIPDITSDARIPQQAYRPTFVKSLVMMPIAHGNITFGAIGTYWAQPYRATRHQVDALSELADATADALDHIAFEAQ